jgi:hypothetical protein
MRHAEALQKQAPDRRPHVLIDPGPAGADATVHFTRLARAPSTRPCPAAPSRTGVSMTSDILCITRSFLCITSLFLCTIGWVGLYHAFARSRVPKRTGAQSSLPCPSISASFPRVGPSRDSMRPARAATLSPEGKRRARQGRCVAVSLAICTVSLCRQLLRFDCAYQAATLRH